MTITNLLSINRGIVYRFEHAISRSRNVASRNIFTGKRELSPEEKRKLSIIENAQIENSRGAMSEILLYISSMVTYYASSSTDPQNEVWMDAWKKKADSIYHNALVLFPDDQIMLKAYEDIESDYSLFQMKLEYLIPQQWIVYSEQPNSIKYYNEDTTMMAEILFVATARSISDDDFTDWFLGRLSVDPADAIIHETYMGITHPARSYMFLVDNSMTDQVSFVIVSDCEGGVVICSIGYEGDNAARASVIISNIVDSFSIPDR